jgi:PAS domain S-box-containing protein
MVDMNPHASNVVQVSDPLQALRQQAEAIAAEGPAPAGQSVQAMTQEQLQQTIHELRVHQIELEMQNEELRSTQNALAAEQARYFDLYDLAPVGYCTVSAAGAILQINLTAASSLGRARGALVKRMFSQCIFLEDQDIYYLMRKKLLAAGEPQSCELRMVKHDGTLVWVHLSAATATEADGAQVLRIVLTDISVQKREEETRRQNQTLLKSEAFTRAIMDSVGAEIAVLNRDGVIVAVNQPWRDFSIANGLVQGEATLRTDIGTNYLAVCQASAAETGENPAPSVCTGIQAVLDGRLPYFTFEYPCDTPQQAHWFSMHVTPLGLDRQGVVISHSNITQRKRAEVALSFTRFSIEAASEALLWMTPDARIVDINAAACHMFGYTREELLRMSVTDMARDPTDIDARWQKHFSELRQSHTRKFETAYYARNGTLISVEVIANYMQFDGKEYSCAFVRDITGRKQNAIALLAAKAEAEKANHAKSRFLAAASHDLRQPLSALSLYVGVLKSRVAPENKDLMARIEACCDSLTQLLSDLLDVSKLDAGVITPKLSDFAVDEFLKPLTTVHAAEANLKGLRLRLHPSGGLVARTDSGLLARVVNNLIANAIRYTSSGGVLVACRRRAGALWIEVWDTGMGIPQDMHEAIFDEFTQLGDDARNRGSGLGLAIVAKTASVLGLKIHLRSRVGRGSMFAVELPIGRINLPAEAQALQTLVRPLRIGLVEDNPDVRQALVLALENFGHQVVSAANGSALLKHLGDQAPDIVISDYRLGAGETGFHVIERVRTSFTADLPAIIITGDTDPAVIRSMTDRGIALHFKPLHLESLMAFITQATERRTR